MSLIYPRTGIISFIIIIIFIYSKCAKTVNCITYLAPFYSCWRFKKRKSSKRSDCCYGFILSFGTVEFHFDSYFPHCDICSTRYSYIISCWLLDTCMSVNLYTPLFLYNSVDICNPDWIKTRDATIIVGFVIAAVGVTLLLVFFILVTCYRNKSKTYKIA